MSGTLKMLGLTQMNTLLSKYSRKNLIILCTTLQGIQDHLKSTTSILSTLNSIKATCSKSSKKDIRLIITIANFLNAMIRDSAILRLFTSQHLCPIMGTISMDKFMIMFTIHHSQRKEMKNLAQGNVLNTISKKMSQCPRLMSN